MRSEVKRVNLQPGVEGEGRRHAAGANVKDARELMRHSTPALTPGLYTRTTRRKLSQVVAAPPDLDTGPDRESARGTGTYATEGPLRPSRENLSRFLSRKRSERCISGRQIATADECHLSGTTKTAGGQKPGETAVSGHSSPTDRIGRGGTRTRTGACSQGILSP